MKKIICFGDSNVFGFNPLNASRFDESRRWSGILKNTLKQHQIIEQGANNRTCFSKNYSENLTGIIAIEKYLNKDYDEIILCIGINDLQIQYNVSLENFENGLNLFIQKIKSINPKIKIIILIPHILNENILNSYFNNLFDYASIEKSKRLPKIYKKVAQANDCTTFDLNLIAKVSEIDSLHFDEKNHQAIAEFLIMNYSNNPSFLPNS